MLEGGVWTPPDVDLAAGADAETAALLARLATLTPQQVRVLMMLSEGLLNKQIAYELCVSEATVKAHVSAILQKLGVESRTQAVIAAAKIEARPVAAAAAPAQHRGAELATRCYSAAATRCTRHCASSARSAAGLIGLLQHLDVARARLVAHARRAVGGDQDRRQVGAEAPAQRGDRLDAVAVVEVIVDQQPVRRACASAIAAIARCEIGRLEHAAAPAAEQRLHAVEDLRLVVDAQHRDAGELAAIDARPRRAARAPAARR